MFVPRHVCAQTRLCPDTLVQGHACAQKHLCPDTIVNRLDCAQTRLCPDTFMPQHESWPDTIMSLVNNNIIIVSAILIMCQLVWGKHTHVQLLLAREISEMWVFNYCSAIASSIPTGIFRYFIIACQGSKYVSGHKRTRFCPNMIVTTRL